MDVLIACEFSGVVRDAFIREGHNALSCDLLPTEADGPHYQGDVRDIIDNGFDLMVAHPPCTYLCNSGVSWLHKEEGRWDKMVQAANFFKTLLNADIPMIAVENPIMHTYAKKIIGQDFTQSIQPYEFGHPESKRTCFWLKNLPPLNSTNKLNRSGLWDNQTPSGRDKTPPGPDRWKVRSKTYQGIADAMADQWGQPQMVQSNMF